MSTFVGRAASPKPAQAVKPAPVEAPKHESDVDKTRAELVEEAEALGIKVPKSANKAQIAKLIEDAPVM